MPKEWTAKDVLITCHGIEWKSQRSVFFANIRRARCKIDFSATALGKKGEATKSTIYQSKS